MKKGNPKEFELALFQHTSTNPHHPEYWNNGVQGMHEVYVAEMVCDWHARSSEFGSDLRTWVKESASKKFEFSLTSKVYKSIKGYLDLLLDSPFK